MMIRTDKPPLLPSLLTTLILLLLGVSLTTLGLLMEYYWDYTLPLYYKPYYTGGLVLLASCFIAVFCCRRTPVMGVVVSVVCLPGLAAAILQLILTGLMAEVLVPGDVTTLCSGLLLDPSTVYCSCVEDISFNVTVTGSLDTTPHSLHCEADITFLFLLMLAVCGICGLLILSLFTYVFWVLSTTTRPTYPEPRGSYYNSTMPRTNTILNGALVLSNSLTRPASVVVPRPTRPASVAVPSSPGFRPVVTVQRSHSLVDSARSARMGQVKSVYQHYEKSSKTPSPPAYNNGSRDIVKAAQYRSEVGSDVSARDGQVKSGESDVQGVPVTTVQAANTPIQIPRNKVLPEELDGDSSDDNTAEVIHDFKSSPKQLNSARGEKIQNLESNLDLEQFGKS